MYYVTVFMFAFSFCIRLNRKIETQLEKPFKSSKLFFTTCDVDVFVKIYFLTFFHIRILALSPRKEKIQHTPK